MSNETQHTPADVRERVAKIVRDAMEDARRSERLNTFPQSSMWDYADRILALFRTPRGDGDVKPLAWRVEYRGRTGGEWEYLNTYDLVEVAKEKVERMRRGGVRLEYRIVPLYPAAFRSEAQGDGPVGAVCANCGAPNAKIAGGELDPDEAVCSVECYEQLRELGCPQEHGGMYRPKPARRGEGGGE